MPVPFMGVDFLIERKSILPKGCPLDLKLWDLIVYDFIDFPTNFQHGFSIWMLRERRFSLCFDLKVNYMLR